MSPLTQAELIQRVLNWVRKNNLNNGNSKVELTEETNLLETGLLDSLEFVNLILFIETECGCKVNLNDVEPEQFTVVKSLCGIALGNGARAAQS